MEGKEQILLRTKSIDPEQVITFLLGTWDPNSFLRLLRGQTDILRLIWTTSCEEWWDYHIERYPRKLGAGIVDLSPGSSNLDPSTTNDSRTYPRGRQECGGCPVATIETDVLFPEPWRDSSGSDLLINMMPIKLHDLSTLPENCQRYKDLILKCIKSMPSQQQPDRIAYLTIDERMVAPGSSHRRLGLHVESPGIMPSIPSDSHTDSSVASALFSGIYVPGAEHGWGGGLMMREETILGGIFMASNVTGSCAVWNCRIRDQSGDIIGSHGNIERLRRLLGPPAKLLESGELVWMTDKTPHESVPLPLGAHRQYFRLVVGDVSVWYADHSTPNPLGIVPDSSTRIITGNKFLFGGGIYRLLWTAGTLAELQRAKEETEFRLELFNAGLGHLSDAFASVGINSMKSFLIHTKKGGIRALFERIHEDVISALSMTYSRSYYEMPQIQKFCIKNARILLDDL